MRHRRLPIAPIVGDTTLAESMRLAQAGDRQAYALILEHCRDAFGRLARAHCPAGACEVEIVRQCLLTLHRVRHTFDPKRSFSAWVDGIARHHGIGGARVGLQRMWRARIGLLVEAVMLDAGVMDIAGRRKRKTRRRARASPSNERSFGIGQR